MKELALAAHMAERHVYYAFTLVLVLGSLSFH